MKIKKLTALEIYNSRGWPTIQCTLTLQDGREVTASVPSGLSKSIYEAHELTDHDSRLEGRGVRQAVDLIKNTISPFLKGREPRAVEMDMELIALEGTPDKSVWGANTLLAVSMVLYRAQALVQEMELFELIARLFGNDTVTMPFPQFNVINGGVHAANKLQIQEFLIVPVGAPDFRTTLEMGASFFHSLGEMLEEKKIPFALGDEGGYSPLGVDDYQALEILHELIKRVEQEKGFKAVIAFDVASSQFYDDERGIYHWHGHELKSSQMLDIYQQMIDDYHIYSIEDGMAQQDLEGWQMQMARFNDKVQLVGDDLFATHLERLTRGFEEGYANAAIIKPNQIGTVTEALQAVKICKAFEKNTIVSHRSGETIDSFIADLAVGTSAGQIKAGGLSRSERLAKYNRLLEIEDLLLATTSDA